MSYILTVAGTHLFFVDTAILSSVYNSVPMVLKRAACSSFLVPQVSLLPGVRIPVSQASCGPCHTSAGIPRSALAGCRASWDPGGCRRAADVSTTVDLEELRLQPILGRVTHPHDCQLAL